MEGLLPAIASAFQLILGHLWGALLVISDKLEPEVQVSLRSPGRSCGLDPDPQYLRGMPVYERPNLASESQFWNVTMQCGGPGCWLSIGTGRDYQSCCLDLHHWSHALVKHQQTFLNQLREITGINDAQILQQAWKIAMETWSWQWLSSLRRMPRPLSRRRQLTTKPCFLAVIDTSVWEAKQMRERNSICPPERDVLQLSNQRMDQKIRGIWVGNFSTENNATYWLKF
nr:uncharacterized protein LOC123284101 [Equus asinus]